MKLKSSDRKGTYLFDRLPGMAGGGLQQAFSWRLLKAYFQSQPVELERKSVRHDLPHDSTDCVLNGRATDY